MSSGPTPGLPSTRFDTAELPARERFEGWQHRLSDAFRLSLPDGVPRTTLVAQTRVWMFDSLMLSPRTCSTHTLTRDEHVVRTTHFDHYKLHVRLPGPGVTRVEADGRRMSLHGGSLVITDMAQPERIDADAGSTIALFVPRDTLNALVRRPLDLHGVVPRGAGAALLTDHLQMLTAKAESLSPAEARHLTGGTLHLIAASIAPTADMLALARPAMEASQLRLARRFVEDHLRDPDLGVEPICRQFHLSRSSVYRLFEPLGGVASYIRERRLARIHAVLASSTERRYLGRLADDYGFKSAAQFSRAFREQFGYSPSDARSHRLPTGEPGQSGVDQPQGPPPFVRWLSKMR